MEDFDFLVSIAVPDETSVAMIQGLKEELEARIKHALDVDEDFDGMKLQSVKIGQRSYT